MVGRYDPAAVANGFLELGFRESVPIDPMKIQKLCFFAHGYYLASTREPLVNERFQAWKLGPVLPSLYQRMKKFKASPITEYGEVYDYALSRWRPAAPPEQDEHYQRVRQFVWNTYGKRESITLSSLTHREGGAWANTIRLNRGIQGPQISDEAVIEEFLPLVTPPAPPPPPLNV